MMKLPEGKLRMVKNVTLDIVGSMRQIAKRSFLYTTQIIDRFHAQMQMQEALQKLCVQIYSHSYDKNIASTKLALWFNKVEEWNYPQFNSVIGTFKNHNDRILNFFENRLTNAAAESFNAKLKSFRAPFRGVDDVRFYLYRVMMLYA